ncbi:MAG: hypothetical protein ACKO96_17685, partial [Flammeovirgaceae bacterium]
RREVKIHVIIATACFHTAASDCWSNNARQSPIGKITVIIPSLTTITTETWTLIMHSEADRG